MCESNSPAGVLYGRFRWTCDSTNVITSVNLWCGSSHISHWTPPAKYAISAICYGFIARPAAGSTGQLHTIQNMTSVQL